MLSDPRWAPDYDRGSDFNYLKWIAGLLVIAGVAYLFAGLEGLAWPVVGVVLLGVLWIVDLLGPVLGFVLAFAGPAVVLGGLWIGGVL